MGEPRPLQARSSSDSNKRRNGGQAQGPKTKRQKTLTTKTKGVGAFHAAAFEALSTLKKNVAVAEKWQQVPRNDASNGTGMGPLARRELSMKAATDIMFRGSNDRCAKACREQSVQGYHQSLKGRTEYSKTTQIVGGVKRYKFVFYTDIGLARHQVTVAHTSGDLAVKVGDFVRVEGSVDGETCHVILEDAPFTEGDVPRGVLGAEIFDQPLKAFMVRSLCVRDPRRRRREWGARVRHATRARRAPRPIRRLGHKPTPRTSPQRPTNASPPALPACRRSSVTTPSWGRHC